MTFIDVGSGAFKSTRGEVATPHTDFRRIEFWTLRILRAANIGGLVCDFGHARTLWPSLTKDFDDMRRLRELHAANEIALV